MPRSARVDEATVSWLLEPDMPSVRLRALVELLGRSPHAREVREARAEIMRRGAVPAILAKQRADGSWGDPAAFYMDKYRGTVWTLLILAEHRADGADPRVRRACEMVLDRSQHPGSGGFSYRGSEAGAGGLPSGVIPCLTGNVVFSLLRLGQGRDERVARGIDWLTRYLRFDDGETRPPADFPYRRCEACYGRHSCTMGVVKGLKALAEIPSRERSAAVRRTIDAAVEFLLAHHLYKRSHDLRRVAKPGWTRFGFPRMYQTDALEMLGLLRRLGCRDPRLGDAVALVRKRRRADGRWNLDHTFNGRFRVRIEQQGRPSKWITLDALVALEAWGAGSGVVIAGASASRRAAPPGRGLRSPGRRRRDRRP